MVSVFVIFMYPDWEKMDGVSLRHLTEMSIIHAIHQPSRRWVSYLTLTLRCYISYQTVREVLAAVVVELFDADAGVDLDGVRVDPDDFGRP